MGTPTNYLMTSTGKEIPGVTTLLADPDDEGNGEVFTYM